MRATDLFLYKKMNIVLARIYRETEYIRNNLDRYVWENDAGEG